jgi:hypothetical protein
VRPQLNRHPLDGDERRLGVHWWINTRDKPGLLWAFLRHFESDSHVSFEGDLNKLALTELPGASTAETPVLRRHTLEPSLDFIAIPITEENSLALRERLSAPDLFHDGGALVHVQVEHAGHLVLGAYDNFRKDCVVAYQPTPESLLEQLKNSGVIRSYDVAV